MDNNIAAAQARGDEAYADMLAGGYGLYAASTEYHVAFTACMARLGTPMPCACEMCAARRAINTLVTVEG